MSEAKTVTLHVEGTDVKLTRPQAEHLASWWEITRLMTQGYHCTELHGRRPSLDVFHRKGIAGEPHAGGHSDWRSVMTDFGRLVAERCSFVLAARAS